jgi:hypothetical protein
MTRAVVFRPQAEDELLEVQRWYESRREGLGDEFGEAIERMVARIAAGPAEFQCVRGATRRAVLNRFPYAIYFRETDSEIMPRGQAARSSWPCTGGRIPRAGGREASPGPARP